MTQAATFPDYLCYAFMLYPKWTSLLSYSVVALKNAIIKKKMVSQISSVSKFLMIGLNTQIAIKSKITITLSVI